MTYRISRAGQILFTQNLDVTEGAEISGMYRFGIQFPMPEKFSVINYYGRGPGENYADRKDGSFVGNYTQSVADQAFPYVRPQETGLKSDVRRWSQLTTGNRGITITSDVPFYASALNYSIESLDEGTGKRNLHFPEVEKASYVNLLIDSAHHGLGCEDSWYSMPQQQFRVHYENQHFSILITPDI